MLTTGDSRIRLGRIGYLNVLPLHYPLETGVMTGDFELVAGPPAVLNQLMDQGRLDLSGCSCIEYARRPEKYVIVPDLAIRGTALAYYNTLVKGR